jgi:hypothetical protein
MATLWGPKLRFCGVYGKGGVDTYRSRPTASARVAFSGSLGTGSIGVIWRSPGSFRHRLLEGNATV